MKNQPEQIEFDLDPKPESIPALPKPEPEPVPLSSEEEYFCSQCEIGGGYCRRHPRPRQNNSIIFTQDSPVKKLGRKDLDEINAEMMSRPPKIDPPATPEEIKKFYEETQKEMEELDRRRAS
jgi:hypothetical protein